MLFLLLFMIMVVVVMLEMIVVTFVCQGSVVLCGMCVWPSGGGVMMLFMLLIMLLFMLLLMLVVVVVMNMIHGEVWVIVVCVAGCPCMLAALIVVV